MKYIVSYNSGYHSLSGDDSENQNHIEFRTENGSYSHEWEFVPTFHTANEVMEYVRANSESDDVFAFDVDNSTFAWS